MPTKVQTAKFAIIGSGFSGICMGIKLLQAGYHNFTIYEKSGERFRSTSLDLLIS
jgi:cation diffusion facilitator CzcD-associated flavoprotein CzcO